MDLLQNSPDNRGMITLCDIRSLQAMSSEAISVEDWLILTLTMITISIGQMTSPINAITHSRRQQVRIKLRLLSICFAIFSPLNFLIMHDK